jgi:peptide/nickel transport system substrate-binding protein
VTNSLDGTVSRINPDTLTVTTYPVGSDPQDVVVADKAVWVAASDSAQIVRLDASTGQVTSRLAAGADPEHLALSDTRLAVTTASIPSRHRGGTLRIAVAPLAGSIDPQSGAAWLAQPWATFAMTNDGLLSLKRAAGPEGNTVVADLAEFIPTPTDGGRTYTFQLRRGVRYSTGALVRASDVRYAIERSFTVNPAPTDFDLGGIFFSDIVGAKGCDHRVRCDLSGGIVTDDQTGRITFHLQHPDPDFLAKLAMPIAAAVPASVSRRDSRTHPLPATGSYEITQYQPGQGATLIRNPHFRQWSRDAQPAGYPDRIVFHVYHSIDVAIAAVERGSADLLFGIQSNGQGAWSPSPSTMRELATRYATQIHPAIVSGTELLGIPGWLAKDRLGRRAISYALDRRKISALLGGPLLAQPTCQLLPPNFPGYRPYCPYTIDPGEHAWSAPDPTKAEQLARRSRNYGRTIIVQADSPLSAYLVHLLDTLGYKAHLQTHQDQQTIGVGDFLEDYPGAADFIQLYAPPFLEHRVDIALAQQLQNPYAGTLAWAALDRRLTDYAAPLFIATDRTPGLVSKRVGNYTTAPGPGNGPIIDQLWVK